MKKNTNTAKNKVKSGLKIAFLAWGSLLSTANKKKLSIVGNKFNANGPVIPLELSRISGDGRLTLVIDENAGAKNKAFYAISKHNSVNKAFDELVSVEKVQPNRIGVVDIKNKQTSECATRHSETTMSIAKWAKSNGIDVVLWSGLGRKFKDKIDVKFSTQAAVNYLNGLPKEERETSLKYIKSLPKNIETPVKNSVLKKW